MIFWGVLGGMVYLAGLNDFIRSGNRIVYKWLPVVVALALFLVSAMRYHIGWDYDAYASLFYSVDENMTYPEKSLIWLSIFLREVGFSSQALIAIYAAITFFFFYKGFQFYFRDRVTPWVLFFFLPFAYWASMNQIRQMAAVSVIFFSSRYLVQRKFYLYAIWTLIAAFFHTSAVVCILLYPFITKKMPLKGHIVVVLGAALLGILGYGEEGISLLLQAFDSRAAAYLAEIRVTPSLGYLLFYGISWLFTIIMSKNINEIKMKIQWGGTPSAVSLQ